MPGVVVPGVVVLGVVVLLPNRFVRNTVLYIETNIIF